jgi:voltage-gated potassium channel
MEPPLIWEIGFDLLISAASIVNVYLYFAEKKLNFKKPASWLHLGLWIDVLCVLPFSLIEFIWFGKSAPALLFLNLLTARHIFKIKKFLDAFDGLQPIVYRLVPLAFTMPLLVHLLACGWIALGSGTAGPDPDKVTEYVKAIYFTFTTLTTVGYGDIAAKTVGQMLFANFTQIVGVAVFGFVLSNVASLLSRIDAAREHHMDNLDRVETFMRLHDIPTETKSKIRSYYHYLWTAHKGYRDTTLVEDLPVKIQSELYFHINKNIIEKVPFLKGASQDLLEDLMNELEPRIFVPGERIFRIDEPGDALYFIQHGSVDILNRENKPLAILEEGAFFGEMAILSDKPRSATAMAGTFCDVYLLHKDAFQRVINSYPEFRQHIEETIKARA